MAPPRTTYREVLADARFRVVFGSRTLAVMGDALRTVALSVLVLEATGSAFLAAVTYGIAFLPQAVGGVLLGSLADTVRPRRVIGGAYLLECGVAAVLALGHLPVSAALALIAVVATFAPILAGASYRVVADALEGDAYVLGRSLLTIATAAAQIAGLAVGGLAVAAVGARDALLVAAAAHLVAALAVRLRLPDLPAGRATGASPVRASVAANRSLLADRRVRLLLLAQWLPPGFATGAESLVIPFAADRGASPGLAAVVLAALPAGMIAGDLLVGRLLRPATRERLVGPLLAVLALPLVPFALGPPVGAMAALLFASGAGCAYTLGLQRPFLDALPGGDRGLAFGLLSAGLMTVQGVGPLVLGAATELVPVGVVIAGAGAAILVTALPLRAAGAAPGDRSASAAARRRAAPADRAAPPPSGSRG
ncbi:MAG: MFS transporter [Thermoleophilia bacterium]